MDPYCSELWIQILNHDIFGAGSRGHQNKKNVILNILIPVYFFSLNYKVRNRANYNLFYLKLNFKDAKKYVFCCGSGT
jgi:hypothetical protein